MKKLKFFKLDNGKEPVKIWLKDLDISIQVRIADRFSRIENGNYGDYKKLNKDISEFRFDIGKGYRIYFHEADDIVILLLNAGNKKRQNNDIEKAQEYLKIWRTNNDRL